MTVTLQGITDLVPTTAVVSFIAPDKPFDFDVIEAFCNYVLNFASRESAERWASERKDIVLDRLLPPFRSLERVTRFERATSTLGTTASGLVFRTALGGR